MGYFKWADKQLQDLMAQNPQYKRSAAPGMRMGVANSLIGSQLPGAGRFQQNVFSQGQNSFNNASKYATDASQLLGVNAGIQGQVDHSLGDLQSQEADWKKFGLSNLNDAYGAVADEDRMVEQGKQQFFQNQVSLKGAQAANKFAKRKALWNTVGGIANLGVSALTGGFKIPKFGKGGGMSGSGDEGALHI